MSVPHTYLDVNSCVNDVIKVFNRKLQKQMNVFEIMYYWMWI